MKTKLTLYVLLTMALSVLLASCIDDDILLLPEENAYDVKLSAKVEGQTFAMIVYSDENGEYHTAAVHDDWEKSFKVPNGYELYLSAIGEVENGKALISAQATGAGLGKGLTFSDTKGTTSDLRTSFRHKISKELD